MTATAVAGGVIVTVAVAVAVGMLVPRTTVVGIVAKLIIMAMVVGVLVSRTAAGAVFGTPGRRPGRSTMNAIAQTLDGRLDHFRTRLLALQFEGQAFLDDRNLNIADAFQALQRTADLAGTARTIHALDTPFVMPCHGLLGYRHWKSPRVAMPIADAKAIVCSCYRLNPRIVMDPDPALR